MSITKFNVTTVPSGGTGFIDFGTQVINASVAVQGYSVSYNGNDHPAKALNVRANMAGIR